MSKCLFGSSFLKGEVNDVFVIMQAGDFPASCLSFIHVEVLSFKFMNLTFSSHLHQPMFTCLTFIHIEVLSLKFTIQNELDILITSASAHVHLSYFTLSC